MTCRTAALAALALSSLASAAPHAAAVELPLPPGSTPARLDVRVELNGRPTAAVWDETFAKLFAFHDRDGDGSLDRAEAGRLPSAFGLRQVLWGQVAPAADAPPFAELDADGNGTVAGDELTAFYRRAGLGDVVIGTGRPPSTDRLTDAILKRIDGDGDGATDAAEWAAAPAVLGKLDANDDELIGPGELVPNTAYPGATGAVLLSAPVSDPGAGSVRWLVRLRGKPSAEPTGRLDAGRVRLELRADAGKLAGQTDAALKRWRARFAEADADSDGVLDVKELAAPKSAALKELAAAADRDADGRLGRAELAAWLDLQRQVASGHALLTALDFGNGLFELLDADRDGALSVRELRSAWPRLIEARCVAAGLFDRAKLPHQLSLTVSHGHPLAALGRPDRGGPAWFRAMDRNGDGDVSRREFTGPAEAFDRLDTDKDGLLTAGEAGKAGN